MMVVLAANRAYGPAYRLQQYGPEWLAGLADMVSAVRATGSRVMVIGPVPRMPNDVPECLAVHLDAVTLCQPPLAEAVDAAGVAAERAVVEAAGGSYLDVTPAFCDEVTCAAVVGNVLVFSDQNHLTTEFAGWLSALISAAVDDAMRRP